MCFHQDDYYFNDEYLQKQGLNWDETQSIDWDQMDIDISMSDGVVIVEGTMVLDQFLDLRMRKFYGEYFCLWLTIDKPTAAKRRTNRPDYIVNEADQYFNNVVWPQVELRKAAIAVQGSQIQLVTEANAFSEIIGLTCPGGRNRARTDFAKP